MRERALAAEADDAATRERAAAALADLDRRVGSAAAVAQAAQAEAARAQGEVGRVYGNIASSFALIS